MSDNFLSGNAYICIELNAHYLVNVIITLRDKGRADLFLPMLFNTQTCEQMFRQIRSMSTLNWTKINFTMLELLHAFGRIQLQNDIFYDKLVNVDISIPRVQKKAKNDVLHVTIKRIDHRSNEQC